MATARDSIIRLMISTTKPSSMARHTGSSWSRTRSPCDAWDHRHAKGPGHPTRAFFFIRREEARLRCNYDGSELPLPLGGEGWGGGFIGTARNFQSTAPARHTRECGDLRRKRERGTELCREI